MSQIEYTIRNSAADKPPPGAKRVAIELLGTCHGISETARKIGRHRKTVTRWLQQPKFEAAVKARLDEFRNDANAGIYQLVPRAIRTLKRSMRDTMHPAAANRAAITVLNKAGLLLPDAPPRDDARTEPVSLGGSLVVMTPAEAAKLTGGENVIVAVPDTDSPSNADHPSGPRPDAEAHRPPAQ